MTESTIYLVITLAWLVFSWWVMVKLARSMRDEG